MPMIRRCLALALVLLPLAACVPGGAPRTIPPDADRDVFLTLVASISDGGKPRAALAYLDDYLGRYPDDARARLLKAEALTRTGNLTGAAMLYHALPLVPEARAGLARVAALQGQWRAAVTQFAAAYADMPSDPRLLNDYGYALLMTGQPGQAHTLLARAHELQPEDQRIRANYLLAAARAGRDADVDKTLAALKPGERRRLEAFLRNGPPLTPTLLERQRDSATPRPPLPGPDAARMLEGNEEGTP